MREKPLVLYVDDDPLGLEVFEAMLSTGEYLLEAAGGGREAIEKARSLVPDLVLLDVMMPDVDGFEVLSVLRADRVLAQVPIVLVTALNDRASRLRGVESGADDFISKPIDRLELLARVRTVTRLNRFRRMLLERAKFEWAVETADDGYVLVSEGDEVRYANPRARALLSFPEAPAAIPGCFLALVSERYRCEPASAWGDWPAGVRPGRTLPRYLVRPESSSEPPLWLRTDTFPLPDEDSWLVRLRDVTGRLEAEREVWAFHSAVRHKLRTPLTAVVSGLKVLTEADVASLPAEKVGLLVRNALRGAERLGGEIEDVLSYIEACREPATGTPFPLAELPALLHEMGWPSVSVRLDPDVERGRLVLARQALELVLRELLENARKFHPRREPAVEVDAALLPDGQVRLSVRDDGAGVPPEELARVLSPYFQVEREHTGQKMGMGLGLAMVAALAWGVGGQCRVENRADRSGLLVQLDVPLAS